MGSTFWYREKISNGTASEKSSKKPAQNFKSGLANKISEKPMTKA